MELLQAASGRVVSELANVLELGTSALPLRQFLATVAGGGRHLNVEQSGDFMKVAIAVPGLRQIVMPPGLTFARLDQTGLAALQGFVRDCKPARLLVVHDAQHAALALRLLPSFTPDMLIWPLDTPLPDAFPPMPQPAHVARLGLAAHALLCQPSFATLRDALIVRADTAARQSSSRPLRVFEMAELVRIEGCWPLERDKFATWCWTGPQRMATILLPAAPAGRLRVTTFFYAAKIPVDAGTLRLCVDGHTGQARHYQNDLKIEIDIFNDGPPTNTLVLRLQHAKLGMTDDGSRPIGVALHKVKCETLA